MTKKWWRPDEVAAQLRVSRRTIYRRLRSGEMAGSKSTGVWRISTDALMAFVNKEIKRLEKTGKIL